jgi:hypothetical protein
MTHTLPKLLSLRSPLCDGPEAEQMKLRYSNSLALVEGIIRFFVLVINYSVKHKVK